MDVSGAYAKLTASSIATLCCLTEALEVFSNYFNPKFFNFFCADAHIVQRYSFNILVQNSITRFVQIFVFLK